MAAGTRRISLLAIPEAMPSTLIGLHDVLSAVGSLPGAPRPDPFRVEIVGAEAGHCDSGSGLPIPVGRSVDDLSETDIVIVPSLLVDGGRWEAGRYPGLVEWLDRAHAGGAVVCSACSGLYLIAETGLFDGHEATIHYEYAEGFRQGFPAVPLSPEKVLVVSGGREELVSSGASTSWHDLALYLMARFVGPSVAQAAARFYAFQWHVDGLSPYTVFEGRLDHGDAAVANAQRWIADNLAVARPAEEMGRRADLPARTFARRFRAATGETPIGYVQRLRVEEAKRRLERTDDPVEDISWAVGYEDPAAFRRLFKRMVGMPPGAFRRRFQVPGYARGEGAR